MSSDEDENFTKLNTNSSIPCCTKRKASDCEVRLAKCPRVTFATQLEQLQGQTYAPEDYERGDRSTLHYEGQAVRWSLSVLHPDDTEGTISIVLASNEANIYDAKIAIEEESSIPPEQQTLSTEEYGEVSDDMNVREVIETGQLVLGLKTEEQVEHEKTQEAENDQPQSFLAQCMQQEYEPEDSQSQSSNTSDSSLHNSSTSSSSNYSSTSSIDTSTSSSSSHNVDHNEHVNLV